jgi:caffeoyl-CoA O-methyltransferase
VRIEIGPALETLQALPLDEPFDFAYIDADKSGYDGYYEACLRLLRPGGLIMLDNVLMGGRVLAPEADDEGATAMVALNTKLASDERVDIAMLGIADGVTLALKR